LEHRQIHQLRFGIGLDRALRFVGATGNEEGKDQDKENKAVHRLPRETANATK
jgi:hypothetical protein